ncbi:MAG: MBL fold metallo-hydrolase [Candidatus Neomarinimicrobiota bacterium]
MKRLGTLIAILLMAVTASFSEDTYSAEVTKVSDHIYQIHLDLGGMEVNAVASVGKDGLLLVDTGSIHCIDTFKEALATFSDGDPKIIINSHAHTDHTGGNGSFGSAPVIIAHEIVRERVRTGSYLLLEYPDEALPDITFKDSMTVYFNGEEIKIISIPGSHDDNDAIVYFTGSNVVYAGDLFYSMMFPTLDGTYGDPLKYAEANRKLIELLPDDAVVIPGHGRLSNMEDLRAFHEMLDHTTEIVKKEYAQGQDLATIQAGKIIDKYDSFNYDLYKTTDGWIQDLHDALKGEKPLPSLTEPLYWEIKKSGAKGAIKFYEELRKDHFEEYAFGPGVIYSIATNYFMIQERWDDAIIFHEYGLEEYSDWQFTWAFYEGLAETHVQLGNNQQAIDNYKHSLELFPDNAAAKAMIKELEAK